MSEAPGQLVDELAAICGVLAEYHQVDGTRRVISTETKRRLLTAMGYRADEDAQLAGTLTQALEHRWCRLLPAVQVVRRAPALTLEVTLPARDDGRYHWELHQEDGGRHRGEFASAELATTDERTIGAEVWTHRQLCLSLEPPLGYHRFVLTRSAGDKSDERLRDAAMTLIVAPERCYRPAVLAEENRRVWGPAVQLYALRSHDNWGIGDFGDLETLTATCSQIGAAVVGLSPLHALFPAEPRHISPYSPSSRLFLNVNHIDVEAVADFDESAEATRRVNAPDFRAMLQSLRAADTVDYPEVTRLKREVLEILFRHFCEHHLGRATDRAHQFRAFQHQRGEELYRHAVFETLHEHLYREGAGWGWPDWPPAYRDPSCPEVLAFARAHAERIEFFEYLQWQAELQLEAAGARSLALGLGIGLYADLAVSVDRAGSEVWANPELFADDVSIGAPPDAFNLEGQDWGLAPWIPEQLQARAYRPFISVLRRNMQHAGALRLDHVMGLRRLYWVPSGNSAAQGAYVNYPFEDLLGIVALESHRNRCLVIGEDLGTVPAELRQQLAQSGVLSYRLLLFERTDEGDYVAPVDYPVQALVAPTTHDLPTLAGFWSGHDLRVRERLGLFPSPQAREQQIVERAQDRARLLLALEREELLPEGESTDPLTFPELSEDLCRRIHLYLAKTPCQVMMLQLEDLLGQIDQPNLPGTTQEHVNWQRKLPLALEQLPTDSRIRSMVELLRPLRVPPAAPLTAGGSALAVPRATYRLQLNRDFGFAAALELVPYLARLGISHCYLSPILRARPGSPHGYDIVDHGSLNPELGSREEFDALVAGLRAHEMGLIVDVVPNHMGVMAADNDWWLDVLENGRASIYADYFDIDWRPHKEELRDKVLLPILGDTYGATLASGQLSLRFDAERGELTIDYYEHRFPVDPGQYPTVLAHDLDRLRQGIGAEHEDLLAFESLITSFGHLPSTQFDSPAQSAERHRDKEIHKQRLAELCGTSSAIARQLDDAVAAFNASVKAPLQHNLLHDLLERQPYRLAFWRVASDEINYRRFFDINELAGIRIEDARVFEDTHRLLLQLISENKIDGLRIDHPDGLYDPESYFLQLQQAAGRVSGQPWDPAMVGAVLAAPPPLDDERWPIHIVVEKILAPYEDLRESWPVHGTTGYEFANAVTGLLIDGAAETALTRIYRQFIGQQIAFDELLYERKKLLMRVALDSELSVLANHLDRISEANPHTRDFTLRGLRDALMEVVACFPVYRTYVRIGRVSADDRRYVEWAVAQAKKRSPAADPTIFDLIAKALLLELDGDDSAAVAHFAMKFQQYTGPVMAKALEDTTFYSYNRLVALNEVGGDPSRFGTSVAAFHRANQQRARRWPHAMLCGSTHDTKRSEDVRARIAVLSEIPEQWRQRTARWSRLNRRKKRTVDGVAAPSRNDEYLLYQTLIGAWPLEPIDAETLGSFRRRIEAYMLKAAREAKVHTSWINPDHAYEQALLGFVASLLDKPQSIFVADLIPFQRQVARAAMLNGLSQTLLKCTAPGIPDIYQGSELWTLSLVDPDNRRSVDFPRRETALLQLEQLVAAGPGPLAEQLGPLLQTPEDGRLKLYTHWQALQLRRELPDLFEEGDYLPLSAVGELADHVCAFARRRRGQMVVTVVPRLMAVLLEGNDTGLLIGQQWGDTAVALPAAVSVDTLTNVLTRQRIPVAWHRDHLRIPVTSLLSHFPVALLTNNLR